MTFINYWHWSDTPISLRVWTGCLITRGRIQQLTNKLARFQATGGMHCGRLPVRSKLAELTEFCLIELVYKEDCTSRGKIALPERVYTLQQLKKPCSSSAGPLLQPCVIKAREGDTKHTHQQYRGWKRNSQQQLRFLMKQAESEQRRQQHQSRAKDLWS